MNSKPNSNRLKTTWLSLVLFLKTNWLSLVLLVGWILVGTWGYSNLNSRSPDDTTFLQEHLVTVRAIKANQPIGRGDVVLARSVARNDVFTKTNLLQGAFSSGDIAMGQPLTFDNVLRYQVVAKAELESEHRITKDDIKLALTPYRDGAHTEIEAIDGWFVRQPISTSVVLLDGQISKPCVVAARKLDSKTTLWQSDIESVPCSDEQLSLTGVFTVTSELVGLRLMNEVQKGTPINIADVEQLYVIPNNGDLGKDAILSSDSVKTEWRRYDPESQAFSFPRDLVGLRVADAIATSVIITQTMVEGEYVVLEAGTEIEPGTLVTNTGQFTTAWARYDLYHAGSFTKPDQLLNQVVQTRLDDVTTPIARSSLQPCYAIVRERIPAYHSISDGDLAINPECQKFQDVLTVQIADRWHGRVTKQAVDKGKKVENKDFYDIDAMSDKVVVSFDMPESRSFNSKLEDGQEITIWFISTDSESPSKQITDVFFLSMTKVDTVRLPIPDDSEQPRYSVPLVSIVAAIPKEQEAAFFESLATSQVYFSLSP